MAIGIPPKHWYFCWIGCWFESNIGVELSALLKTTKIDWVRGNHVKTLLR